MSADSLAATSLRAVGTSVRGEAVAVTNDVPVGSVGAATVLSACLGWSGGVDGPLTPSLPLICVDVGVPEPFLFCLAPLPADLPTAFPPTTFDLPLTCFAADPPRLTVPLGVPFSLFANSIAFLTLADFCALLLALTTAALALAIADESGGAATDVEASGFWSSFPFVAALPRSDSVTLALTREAFVPSALPATTFSDPTTTLWTSSTADVDRLLLLRRRVFRPTALIVSFFSTGDARSSSCARAGDEAEMSGRTAGAGSCDDAIFVEGTLVGECFEAGQGSFCESRQLAVSQISCWELGLELDLSTVDAEAMESAHSVSAQSYRGDVADPQSRCNQNALRPGNCLRCEAPSTEMRAWSMR